MIRRLALALALAGALSGGAGCGLGAGDEQEGDGATLRVTRDFGHELLDSAEAQPVREADTVLRLLQSQAAEVETGFGGGFVSTIDGLSSRSGGEPHDWFYWVNGIEAGVGAGDYGLSPGDVVHWDFRRWDGAMRVPAIVGAYPEPFLHGLEGKRLPVRVECADAADAACEEVKDRLGSAGVPATGASFGSSGGAEVLRVVVAPWREARALGSLRVLEQGPEESGVFARFADAGGQLELLGPGGEAARSAPAGTGLVAAITFGEAKAIWVITGLDDAGVLAAARALDPEVLRDAFALAVLPTGPLKLPVVEEER